MTRSFIFRVLTLDTRKEPERFVSNTLRLRLDKRMVLSRQQMSQTGEPMVRMLQSPHILNIQEYPFRDLSLRVPASIGGTDDVDPLTPLGAYMVGL